MGEQFLQTIYNFIRAHPDRTAPEIRRSVEVSRHLRQLGVKRCAITPYLLDLKGRRLVIMRIPNQGSNPVWRIR